MVNSCGPEKVEIKDPTFEEACYLHDEHYEKGEISRKEADKVFLENMLKSADTWYRKARAYLYYFMVRIFGILFYNKD